MKKRRIVIASILKPVDDTRMLDKMGRTLNATGNYEITLIGYPSRRNPDGGEIRLLPHREFTRLSPGRLLAPLKVLVQVLKVRPHILIVNTHELLIVACVYRIFFGCPICYDVRENYYRNLKFSNAFPPVLKDVLALWVRLKEKATAPLFYRFFLAEKGYEKEMNFFRGRQLVLENKAIAGEVFPRKKTPGKISLLFTGTLAESTGVFEAIRLTKLLYSITRSIHLRIIGSSAQYSTLKKINAEIGGVNYIELTGGSRLVPHDEIVRAIYASDFGIICYPPSPHTENAIPTKLYEYLAARLPIIIQNQPVWLALCEPSQGAVAVDFNNLDGYAILEQMENKPFYSSPPVDVTWQSEGRKLVAAVDGLN